MVDLRFMFTSCSGCVIQTLEGIGITASQCPVCLQPAWKNDLHTNHLIMNAVLQVKDMMGKISKEVRNAGKSKVDVISYQAVDKGHVSWQEETEILRKEIALLEAAILLCDEIPVHEGEDEGKPHVDGGTVLIDPEQENSHPAGISHGVKDVVPDSQLEDRWRLGVDYSMIEGSKIAGQSFSQKKKNSSQRTSIKELFAASHGRKQTKNRTGKGTKVVWSNLKSVDPTIREKFRRIFHDLEEQKEVQDSTTHVILDTTESLIAKQRSRKYLAGCAIGCWLVTHAWVEACVTAGYLVPEKKYEVRGVMLKGKSPREQAIQEKSIGCPERSRLIALEKKNRIFCGMHVSVSHFQRREHESPEEYKARRIIVTRLLHLGKAQVTDIESVTGDTNVEGWIAVTDCPIEVERLVSKGFSAIAQPVWVYDCLTVGHVLDVGSYKPGLQE